MYNHIFVSIKGGPLNFARIYLNVGNRAIQDLLFKYINAYQWRLMTRDYKLRLTFLIYHNEMGRHGLRDYISFLSEVFVTLAADGASPSEEEKLLHLTDRILNDKLTTTTIYHIFSNRNLSVRSTSEAT